MFLVCACVFLNWFLDVLNLFFFLPFKATSLAYGGSQARGLIRATVAGLHHSHSNSNPSCMFNLCLSLWECKFFFFFFFFCLFRAAPWHTEVPRLGVEFGATATATLDPSHIWDLHCSLWQWQILNPDSKAGNRTCILVDTSRVLNPLSYNGNSWTVRFKLISCLIWKYISIKLKKGTAWKNLRPSLLATSPSTLFFFLMLKTKQSGKKKKKN